MTLGLHLIGTGDRSLEKCRKEGVCRKCQVNRIHDVELIGGGDPLAAIPLCAHCEDGWRRGELNIGDLLNRREAAFVVRALGFTEADRLLNPLEFHRAIVAARDAVEEAA
jgi:hypothetical protein